MFNLPRFLGKERHHHLHSFNFSIWLACLDFCPVWLQETNELASDISSQLAGVKLGWQKMCFAIQGQTQAQRLLDRRQVVSRSSVPCEQRAIALFPNLRRNTMVTISGVSEPIP